MLKAYAEGKDLYAMIAASGLNTVYEECLEFYPEGYEIEVDGHKIICGNKTHLNKHGKSNRNVGKKLLLASTYGMSGATAGAELGKTAKEGQELLDNFFKGFPKVKEVIDYSKRFLKEHGYVEDAWGRRRHLTDYFLSDFDIRYRDEEKNASLTFNPIIGCENRSIMDPTLSSYLARARSTRGHKEFETLQKEALAKDGVLIFSNSSKIAAADRQCFNARIQGSAATLTKLAMINIYRNEKLREYGARLIITVHDEVLVECKEEYADEVEKLLPQIMIDTAKPYLNVGMKCDPYNVSRWYADTAASTLIEEFKKLLDKHQDRALALEALYKNHTEIPQESIQKTIETGCELTF